MPYGQQTAITQQTTIINIASTDGFVAMEGSTALAKRFATKLFFRGKAADRLRLSYDSTLRIDQAGDELGSGNVITEPNSTGLTLYGQLKSGSGDTARVIVTEYGF